ncbi:vacuolar-type H+-ATPase subunit D/Vma8 [Kribbella sp. VKM Ac-2571]|uniref:V-type ATP synthase subunit D n=1 Tax=Kribbella sp. VKM Ac-2571 TaxID=2512222 RepID=UPI00105CB5E6|nr:V-type ATP synthase subunit D [Kribbella sp. VKM Ac-2571]TDO58758.1 vacuolar-type H+-ATPase subunit D/Vma8 [Kribbella sp. VKM Ac-2571]
MSGGRLTGRAGRLALTARLATAQRAVELLDRKQRALAVECERLELVAGRAADDFEHKAGAAARWARRCVALDGQRRLLASAPEETAEVAVGYDATMGVRHPTSADVTFGPEPDLAGSSALVHTMRAHREALAAAVQLAAAQRAVVLVSDELALTRQQQRALELRWIPKLDKQLTALAQRLDESEREENVRLRWAAGRAAGVPKERS